MVSEGAQAQSGCIHGEACGGDEDASNLGACALLMLRETLETQRRLTVTENGRDTPVADLLPAVVAWFKFAGFWLLKSSLATEGSVMEDFLALGGLAQKDRILARVLVSSDGIFGRRDWNS